MVFVGLADSVMISSVGEAAISSISLVDSLMFLFLTILTAFATGGAVIVGQYLGRKDYNAAGHTGVQLIYFCLAVGILITLVLELFSGAIVSLIFGEVESSVFEYAVLYLRITTLSLPIYSVYIAVGAIFRAQGNTRVPMLVSVGMNIINVVGNAICIYGLNMQVEGAAIPTLVSRCFAGVLLFVLLVKSSHGFNILKHFKTKLDGAAISRILRIGIPSGIEGSSFQLGKVILTGAVSTLGTTAITANAITGSFAIINCMPGMAVSIATVTVVARCIGAGDYEQAKYYHKFLFKISYVCTALISLFVILISDIGLGYYNLSESTHELTRYLILIHCVGSILLWTPAFHIAHTLRSAGDVRYSMVVSMVSMFVFRVFLGYVMATRLGFGVAGAWYAMMIDWVVRTVFYVYRYKSNVWMNKKVI